MYHLLVVDDEANIRRVVREYAEFEEYEPKRKMAWKQSHYAGKMTMTSLSWMS